MKLWYPTRKISSHTDGARVSSYKSSQPKITKREINIEDKIKDIRTILKKRKRVNFLELFTEVTKESVIVTFLSILEMAKNEEITLTQEDNFSPIMIERK